MPHKLEGNYMAIAKFTGIPTVNPKDGSATNIQAAEEEYSPSGVSYLSLLEVKERDDQQYTGALDTVNDYIDYILWNNKYKYQSNVYNVVFQSEQDLVNFEKPENKVEFIKFEEQTTQETTQADLESAIVNETPPVLNGSSFNGKTFLFTVGGSSSTDQFLFNEEIGTFSVVNMFAEENPYAYEEEFDEFGIIDDEYVEIDFTGEDERIEVNAELEQATVQYNDVVSNAEPSEIIDNDGVLGGSNIPSVKGAKKWEAMSDLQEKNAIFLYKTALTYGFSDTEARAMLGIVSKESAFVPRPEVSYRNTKAERIRFVFPGTFGSVKKPKLSDSEIDALKKNDKAFWNKVYGNKYGNGPDDGWRYLGRGFNGLTFKGAKADLSGYIGFNILYERNGSKGGKVDIVTNPELVNKQDGGIYKVASHMCCLYFLKNKNKYFKNAPTDDLDKAIYNFMRANAGWGSSTNGNIFKEGLAKAKAFATSLPKKIG